jgi:DNA-directed RNA polymerase specialized sigma subunit
MNGMDATESDKLHLVMVCADEIAPRYNVEPEELWGVGWLGVKQAEATWEQKGPFLWFARARVRGAMLNYFAQKKIVCINLAL